MRTRRVLSVLCTLVGAIVALLGLAVAVANHSLFSRPAVSTTVSRIVADPDVERLVARQITTRVVTLGALQPHAGVVAAEVDNLVKAPAVQADLSAAAMATYDQLVSGTGPEITFNLPNEAAVVRTDLVALDARLNATLPDNAQLLRFTLFRRSTLPVTYHWAKRSRQVAEVTLIIGLALLVLGLALGPGRFGLLSWAAGCVGVIAVTMFISLETAASDIIARMHDPVAARVTRLSTDTLLASLRHATLGVVIFSLVALVGGLVGVWIRATYYPETPKAWRR